MRSTTKKLVKELLYDYPLLSQRIKLREEELRHPVFPTDENVGGGRTSKKDADGRLVNMIVTLEEDEELQALKRQQTVIEYTFNHSDELTKQIIDRCFFHGHNNMTIGALVDQGIVPCERTAAYKYLNAFMAEVARGLGLKYV